MDKWALRGHFYSYVDPVWSLYNIGTGCHEIAQVVFGVELPVRRRLYPIFAKSRVLGKGDSMEWCWVTRHPQIFRGLTGCQRTPGIWGVTFMEAISVATAALMLAGVIAATIAQASTIGDQGGLSNLHIFEAHFHPALKEGENPMVAGHCSRSVEKNAGASGKRKVNQPSSSSRNKQKAYSSYRF